MPPNCDVIKWKLFKKHIMESDNTYTLFLPKNRKQVLETIELIKKIN